MVLPYDHRAAGDARCHHGLVAIVVFVALAHAIGWPADRGMLTICWRMSLSVRLMWQSLFRRVCGTGSLDRRSSDGSRCDAAERFFVITLPMIMPAIISGWLLVLLCRLMIWLSPALFPGREPHVTDAGLF